MKDLDVPKIYLNNEINFLKFVVKPLWVTMTSWLQPNLNYAGENVDENILMFAERLENLPNEEE